MVDTEYIRGLVQNALKEAGTEGRSALAARWGISIQYIIDVARGYRDPGKSILNALGYERIVLYRKIGERE